MVKAILIFTAVIGLFCCEAKAQKAFLFESLSIPGGTTTATVGTSTLNSAAMDTFPYWKAVYTVEGGTIRFRCDYGSTEATNGHIAVDGDVITLYQLSDIRGFRAVQTGSATTNVRVTYFREAVKR